MPKCVGHGLIESCSLFFPLLDVELEIALFLEGVNDLAGDRSETGVDELEPMVLCSEAARGDLDPEEHHDEDARESCVDQGRPAHLVSVAAMLRLAKVSASCLALVSMAMDRTVDTVMGLVSRRLCYGVGAKLPCRG